MKFIDFLLSKSKFFVFLILILGLAHLYLGRMKWQNFPIYFLVLLYLLVVIFDYFNLISFTPHGSRWLVGLGGFLVIASLSLNALFPTDSMPNPGGPFVIGTQTFELTDDSRIEQYSESQNEARKIKYQVWYPADDVGDHKKVKWIPKGTKLTRQLAKSMHAPYFILDHLAEIDSNSYENLDVSLKSDKYPVVVISHGWKGFRELHTNYAESLASHGFIAVSIDHTYGSQYVLFENGEEAYLNKKALPNVVSPSEFNLYANQLATTYGEDVNAVLDDLKNLDLRLDLDRIGVLGHSTGGGGDVSLATSDKRIKALLGFDAWVNPLELDLLEKGLSIPSVFVRSEQWGKGPNNKALDTLIKNSSQASFLQMNETKHVDFSMSYMISPILEKVGFIGSLGGEKSAQIQNRVVIDFFKESLFKTDKDYDDHFLEEITIEYDAIDFIRFFII